KHQRVASAQPSIAGYEFGFDEQQVHRVRRGRPLGTQHSYLRSPGPKPGDGSAVAHECRWKPSPSEHDAVPRAESQHRAGGHFPEPDLAYGEQEAEFIWHNLMLVKFGCSPGTSRRPGGIFAKGSCWLLSTTRRSST